MTRVFLAALLCSPAVPVAAQEPEAADCTPPQPTAQEDHAPMMEAPGIESLRPGASRAPDDFEADTAVDAKRVGIEGSPRHGTAAPVAMALDRRFAIGVDG